MLNYYTIKTQFGENIIINTDDGTFAIVRYENGDLYWNPIRKNYQEEDTKYKITRENYSVFNVFNVLYEDLIECQLFSDTEECLLTDGNVVNWYSDEEMPEKDASLLQMCKEEGDIKLVFKKGKNDNYRVRIKNHGSRYNPANESFMEMYDVLAYNNLVIDMEKYPKKVLKRKM